MEAKSQPETSARKGTSPDVASVALEGPPGFSVQSLQLQNIFDNFPEALIILDETGEIQHMNLSARDMLRKPDRDIEPENWPEAFGLYQTDSVTLYPVQELPPRRALNGETVQDKEMILCNGEDKTARWISMSSWPFKGTDGSVEGVVVHIQDITSNKTLEQSRQRHIQRTETLYKLSHIIADCANDLDKLTQAVAILASQIIGDLAVVTLLHQDDEKIHIAAYYDPDPAARTLIRKILEATREFDQDQGLAAKVMQTGEPVFIPSIPVEQLRAVAVPEFQDFVEQIGIESVLVVPMTGRTGVLGAISLSRHSGHPPFDHADQSFLMDIASRTALAVENSRLFESLRREISERKAASEALDVSERRFRAIFEATALGIKVLDLDGNILQANSAYESMIGYELWELVGRHFADFIHPIDKSRAVDLLRNITMSNASYARFEHRGLHKDGSLVWMKTVFTSIKNTGSDKNPAFVVGIIENINEQKRIAQEIEELNDRLHGSVEMERLRLAQELHDNPMQTLYSAIYQVEELRNAADPELKDSLEKVNDDIKVVLDGLRSTAKELRPPTLFSFGLEHAIRSHVDDIRDKYPGIKISLSLAHDRQLLPEKARLALFRVAQQSLSNVLRHADATEVKVRFTIDAEEVRLEIVDNGKGFEVPRNWIELVRHGHYGLAGAHERIQALGGSFSVQSQPGNSTTALAVIPWRNLQE